MFQSNDENNNKSIEVNALLNAIQTIVSMLFPLISFPYVTRVLGVDNVGKYSFSNNIVSYFVLLAGLGVSTYGIKEGAKYRDNKEAFNIFVKELFSINVVSTFASIFLLVLCSFLVPKLANYKTAIFILGFQIIFITFGRGWIFSVFEDYLFLSVRTIVFYSLSLFLLFLFVRDENDLYIYCIICVVSYFGINILNCFCGRKYCRYSFDYRINYSHIKPILLAFGISLSVVIYTASDVTILGFFYSDRVVGLYSASVKIYNIVKQILASLLIVTIPRFSYYLGIKEKEKYNNLLCKVANVLVLVVVPSAVGLFCLSRDCILLIAGRDYADSTMSLRILSIAIVFNIFAYMFGYCVLIPNNKEGDFLKVTVISAVINIFMNLILIPKFSLNAAAITTLIAEAFASLLCYKYSLKIIIRFINRKNAIITLIGCLYVLIICLILKTLIQNNIIARLGLTVPLSIIGYLIIHYCLGNGFFIDSTNELLGMLHKKDKNKRSPL